MEEKNGTPVKSNPGKVDLDWDNRVLCSDGNCIGTIGVDGLCKECGKAYEGELPWKVSGKESNASQPATTTETESQTDKITEPTHQTDKIEASAESDDWDKRRLCSDGNCIGVIGPDGNCKECGKPYEG